ncbi:MAG: UDP-N-acetylmuramoylalanyl-D-glutamate--L-ornithine ligase [uncultured Thermomicrobiales bacterium]|uniref:UDP-N-acetylmuramyl-tripeptide synthetase n=1 Tax=uncultured Thermomicrobiales bacterium TaxID=1645740 RepID=A0A6J4URD5_9BACT|nr:MAG: UDP-N-acetylmuramoylalanyl-D-glutamate--L-ornithine ligase [uncultured Thermomicrobiales bacterium]
MAGALRLGTSLRALLAAAPDGGDENRVIGDDGVTVSGIAYDSRKVEPGDLFVALRGAETDGHRFVAEALGRGAIAALTEEPVDGADLERLRCNVIVPNTRAVLARVAASFYREPSREIGLVGVTGTKGKTTTSFMIEAILAEAGRSTGLIGTVDLKIGARRWRNPFHQTTPESLDVQRYLREMVDAGVEWAVLETSSHALETHRVDRCAYDIAVVTNVTHEHLDFHHTYERYLGAKAKLFDSIASAGEKTPTRPRGAIINRDDPGAASLRGRAPGVPELSYGLSAGCDVRAEDVAMTGDGLSFQLCSPQGNLPVRLSLLGSFNVYNALAAAATAFAAGVPPDMIAAALARFPGVPGRLQRIDAGQPFLLLVDYAHNPDSLAQVLRLLRSLVPGRLIALFGSGGERDRAKRPIMGRVCAEGADFGIFTDEDPRGEDPEAILAALAEGAAAAGWVEGRHYERIADRRAAIERALALARPGDAVVLAGKGHENSIIYADHTIPWDEATEASEALARLGYR